MNNQHHDGPRVVVGIMVSLMMAVMGTRTGAGAPLSNASAPNAQDPWGSSIIDVHVHLGGKTEGQFDQSALAAVASMKRLGIGRLLIMPPPFCPNHSALYTYRDLLGVAQKHSDCFSFLGGGGTLNVMIQQAAQSGTVSAASDAK